MAQTEMTEPPQTQVILKLDLQKWVTISLISLFANSRRHWNVVGLGTESREPQFLPVFQRMLPEAGATKFNLDLSMLGHHLCGTSALLN